MGAGGMTAGGGSCAAAPPTSTGKANIAKQQERNLLMSLSRKQLDHCLPARLGAHWRSADKVRRTSKYRSARRECNPITLTS